MESSMIEIEESSESFQDIEFDSTPNDLTIFDCAESFDLRWRFHSIGNKLDQSLCDIDNNLKNQGHTESDNESGWLQESASEGIQLQSKNSFLIDESNDPAQKEITASRYDSEDLNDKLNYIENSIKRKKIEEI